MQKKLMYLEIAGILFIVIMSVFMQNLVDLSGHTRIGVMFGSVNDSIWEIEKTLLARFKEVDFELSAYLDSLPFSPDYIQGWNI